MDIEQVKNKYLWKFWEYAHAASWYVLGDLPFTWDLKHKRNMAYMRYTMPERKK